MENIKEIVKRERATLEWIRHKTGKSGHPGSLYHSSDQALMRLGGKDDCLSAILNWKIDHAGLSKEVTLHVGCEIYENKQDILCASYFIAVSRAGDNGPRGHVLRKYHFDYANPEFDVRQPQPMFHLQYAGRLPGPLKNVLEDEHLYPKFDEPRLLYSPMSLALLLHISFREFPGQQTEDLRTDGYWLSKHIKKDQEEVLRPFYQKCLKLIDDKKIVMDYAYDG